MQQLEPPQRCGATSAATEQDPDGPPPRRSTKTSPRRPVTRRDFEIAVICALPLEADAVEALFDRRWGGDDLSHGKAPGDPNAYSAGALGRHNVVLAHMSGM